MAETSGGFDSIERADAATGNEGLTILERAIRRQATFEQQQQSQHTQHNQLQRMSSQFDSIPPPDEDSVEVRRRRITDGAPPKGREFAEPWPITEGEAKEALAKEAKKHSCWKDGAIKRMDIQSVEQVTCLHYTLESFTEARSTTVCTEAYTIGQFLENQSVLGNTSLVTIDPWDYDIQPAQEFMEEIRVVEMPGTTNLAACTSCNTEGITHCFHCRGYGTDKCQYCRGTGMKAGIAHPAIYTHPMIGTRPHADLARGYPGSGAAVIRPHSSGGLSYGVGTPIHFMNKAGVPPPGIGHHDLCHFCTGRGIKECHHCKGHGKKACTACGGSGSVRNFTKLKVKFGVERSEFYFDQGIPEKLLQHRQNMSGEIILAEAGEFILPLRRYPLEDVNDQSRRLCSIHLQKAMGTSRILQQRHTLEAVPVAKVTFRLSGKTGVFWVYGQERRCYVPNYPSKCSIL